MNYHKENRLVKKRYAIRWKTAKPDSDVQGKENKAEALKERLEQRESRILRSIGNLSQEKKPAATPHSETNSEGQYGAILMKISDRCLSGDEDEEDHFAI